MNATPVETTPLFGCMPKRDQKQIALLADELSVRADAQLTRQDEYAREFFVIVNGTAEVTMDGKHVAGLGPGDFFGEVGLIDGPFRTASVSATSAMELLVLAAREFRTLLYHYPAIAEQVQAVAEERCAGVNPSPAGGI